MLLFGRSRDVAFRHEMNSVARAEAGIDLDETAFIGFSVQVRATRVDETVCREL